MVAKQRLEAAHNDRVTLAYVMASLSRAKKLPNLKTLLVRPEVKQNSAQILGTVKAIAEAYGLPLRKKKKKR